MCFKIVPVNISCQGSTKQITTYAFLDGSSDATFCLEELGLKDMKPMKPTSFTMTTANLEEETFEHEVRLDTESLEGDAKFQLTNDLTTDSLPVTQQHIATKKDLQEMSPTSDVNLTNTGKKNVTILIGRDHPDITDKQGDKTEGKHGESMAVKTPLGWTICGPITEPAGDRVHVNFTRTDQERLNVQLERI